MVRAVVFDCDGLLLETESRWTLAEREVCHRGDVPFSMELKRRLLGTSLGRAGELLAEWVGETPDRAPVLADALITAYREAVDEHGVEPMPGAADLVITLCDRVPIAVASNTREADTRRVLARSGLPEVFAAIVRAETGPGRLSRSLLGARRRSIERGRPRGLAPPVSPRRAPRVCASSVCRRHRACRSTPMPWFRRSPRSHSTFSSPRPRQG